jgi:hypothetical protein
VIPVIPFIHHGVFKHLVRRERRKYLVKTRHIPSFAASQHARDSGRLIETACVDFGGKAPSSTSQSLCCWPAVFLTRLPHADVHARWGDQ